MSITGSDFRLSKGAQRRWQDYPELDSIIIKSFDYMLNAVAREKHLDINLLQQLNHAVLSDASSKYSIRALSSILNKLHADLKEFIAFLEVKFKVEDGYDFLSARMECDYFDKIKSYDQVFSAMPIEQVAYFYLSELKSDISKNSLNSIQQCVRLRSFSSNEREKLSHDFFYIVKRAPEVFHDINKSEVIKNTLLKDIIVDVSLDVNFELTENESSLFARILDMYSKSLSGSFIEKINETGNKTEGEKKSFLRFIINDRLGVDLIDISDYISEMVSVSHKPLGDQYRWVQEMACSHLLSKNRDWSYYYFSQAAIVYNTCQDPRDAVKAFLNAAERESLLNESDIKDSIALEYKDRNEVTLLYPLLCKFIFELPLMSRGMIGSMKDTQARAILYSIATKTEDKFFEAYLKAYSNALSIARFDNHREKINDLFQMAKDRFELPIEKLSPSSRRIVIESELSI